MSSEGKPTKAVIKALRQLLARKRDGYKYTSQLSEPTYLWLVDRIPGLICQPENKRVGTHIANDFQVRMRALQLLKQFGEGPKGMSEKARRSKRLNFIKLRVYGMHSALHALEEWAKEYGYGYEDLGITIQDAKRCIEELEYEVRRLK